MTNPGVPSAYPAFAVTTDIAVLTLRDDMLQVALVKRGEEPFKGAWALPGGFKTPDESLDAAARRELKEETGLGDEVNVRQIGAFGDPERDPRGNVVTVCYMAATHRLGDLEASGDASQAQLWPVREVLQPSFGLAFDHAIILRTVVERVQKELDEGPLATEFLPNVFTLTELRRVYEVIWETELDPGNFHRQATSKPGWVVKAHESEPKGTHPGRPATRYRKAPEWRVGAPAARPHLATTAQHEETPPRIRRRANPNRKAPA